MIRRLSLVVVLMTGLAGPSLARTIRVHLDTSEWRYHRAYLLFTYVTSVDDSIPLEAENRIRIRNFRFDGQMGEDASKGGVLGGRHNALQNQPYSWTIDPDEGGGGRSRYNEVPVNFAHRYALDPDALWLGTYIDFELELPDAGFIPAGVAPDALTMSLLDEKSRPAFRTEDRFRGDALITCSPRREGRDWHVEAYSPAVYHRTWGGLVERIDVRLPRPPVSAGGRVEPIHLPASIGRVERSRGVVWISYTIPVQTRAMRLRVLDSRGRECFRRERADVEPGTYGQEWPEPGGTSPAPGKYRVILECDGQTVEKRVEL